MGFGRRGVLAALATGVGVALVPAPPSQPQLGRVQSADGRLQIDGVDAEGTIRDERDSPVARYHYKRTDDGFEPTSPINVVFDLERAPGGLERVMAPLEDAGWVRRLEEYTRYAYDADRDVYVRQQATAAETYYGTSGRRHVRCWQFGSVVSMQAHVDTGARPKHGIESYTDAREYLSRLYAGEGWDVSPRALTLENAQDPDHDGYATVIHEVEP
ncbi:hypothetical protein ACLI4U_08415 [Natrialbaceae archaeon A-CW2]|uniref:hypothetical protein n=1 Tax=Natronosalvus amylolyticus TaxID=2961994 RepID=UPI0020C9FFFB|nr:hypothetical protein [Natronosalvus amylolyticus]